MTEELGEYADATTLEDEVDALLDLIYVAAGDLYERGVDGGTLFRIVHGANMGKVRGEKSGRTGSLGYDAIKPVGWCPPDHVGPLSRTFDGKAYLPTNLRPKIILLGHARHGKDTVAEMLRDQWGFEFQSSSMFCAEKVLMPYFDKLGRGYATVAQCYEDRVNHRARWYDQIEAYNSPDKARLCRELFEEGNDVYVGMRSAEEFHAAQKLADLVIWVDRSDHLPPEDASSCTVTPDMADFILDNNGTLGELEGAIEDILAPILQSYNVPQETVS